MLAIVVEFWLSSKKHQEVYDWKDLRANVAIGIGGALFSSLLKRTIEFGLFLAVFEWGAPVRQEILGYYSLGWGWWVWILAIIGDDFTFYWHHRWSHEIRILWAAHVVHHSSTFFNFSTGLRNGWAVLLYKHFWWLWMPALGFEPAMVITALFINSIYQFTLHTRNIRRFWLPGTVFVTPWFHEVHHASNVQYLDKNYAGIFILWDRIFGTFQKQEPSWGKPVYGVLDDPHSVNPVYLHLHEFVKIARDVKRAVHWKEALKYVFGRPGWSADGSTHTAKALQEEFYQQLSHDAAAESTLLSGRS